MKFNNPERDAVSGMHLQGFHLKPSPPGHELTDYLTSDALLFETIHMGAPIVDVNKWRLVVDGWVDSPMSFTWDQLRSMPSASVVAFHECFGSPLKPADSPVHRIGNVKWTGVPLRDLLRSAGVKSGATHVWSDGLDQGEFGGITVDRYQKDLPMEKAVSSEVLVAYAINDEPLSIKRGGPVRLVVPGYFGTNSTKWLCRISVQDRRSPSPFTTVLYNEVEEENGRKVIRPVWQVTPHSFITSPHNHQSLKAGLTKICGWAWSGSVIRSVELSIDEGHSWSLATVQTRVDMEWQFFQSFIKLPSGTWEILCRATNANGDQQPLIGRRNEVKRLTVIVR